MLDLTRSIQFMLAGYTVIFLVLGLYLASLFVRHRNLKRDLELLDEIEAKSDGSSSRNYKQEPRVITGG